MGRFHLLRQEGYSIFSFGIKGRKRVDSIIPTYASWNSFPEHKKGQYTHFRFVMSFQCSEENTHITQGRPEYRS